jgi:hypothetical protein
MIEMLAYKAKGFPPMASKNLAVERRYVTSTMHAFSWFSMIILIKDL